MTCDPAQKISPALIMLWSALTDTDGETLTTTWEQWFATFERPDRFTDESTHPGWSACCCEPPRRKASNVVGVSALVLDYDAGTTSLDDAAALWADHFGAMHTTRSHKPEHPRFRVILPLTRIVTPDEFAVVWRWASKIAAGANHKIDTKTKDLARLWYRPALTEGYETRRLTGDPIDPDPIIAAHKYDENERQREREEQRSPAQSTDIEKRASKYLAKLPEAISGSGGHQALWTAALALVRGFRLPPERALSMLSREYNPRCKPMWSERELRHKVTDAEADATTPYGYLADRVRAVPNMPEMPPDDDWVPTVPDDFVEEEAPRASMVSPIASVAIEWSAQLAKTPQGHVRNTFDNICRILEHHPKYGENLTYDEMRLTPLLGERAVNDADVGRIRRELEQNFGIQAAEANVRAALCTVSDARRFHPVRRYLTSLEWDGESRIERVASTILHADVSPLNIAMVRKWFISAAARALDPGCKCDDIFVLQGSQGSYKSTFFSTLGGKWFSDTFMNITDKDGLLQLHSAWIYEWAEIESITNVKQASTVRAFASSKSDSFRAPFGRTIEIHPRSNVIVGSVNPEQFLTDPEGTRRFHVVQVPKGQEVDINKLTEWRDQLWAEAVSLYKRGEQWHLTKGEEAKREEANREFDVEDSWEQPVSEWLARKPDQITTFALLTEAVKLFPGQITRATEMRMGNVMKRLGYVGQRHREGSRLLRVWKVGTT